MSMLSVARRGESLGFRLLIAGALFSLPACSRPAPQSAEHREAADGQRALNPEAVLAARWAAMFANPAAVVAAANEFGYAASAWGRTATGGYQSLGAEQHLPAGTSPSIVHTGFKAIGAGAGRVDAITFTFAVDSTSSPDTRKTRDAVNIPRRIVAGFLSRFGVSPDDAVRRAVQTGTSTTMRVNSGSIAVEGRPAADGAGYRSTVTIAP